jgi:hypothetical protein
MLHHCGKLCAFPKGTFDGQRAAALLAALAKKRHAKTYAPCASRCGKRVSQAFLRFLIHTLAVVFYGKRKDIFGFVLNQLDGY